MNTVPCVDADGLRDYRAPLEASSERPRRRVGLWLVFLAFVAGFFLGSVTKAESCVRLQVRPRAMLAPATIDIQARIARHADHAAYRLDWDSDEGSAGSSGPIALAGEGGPALLNLRLVDQPVGHYEFLARVFDRFGKVTGSDRARIDAPALDGSR